MSPDQTTSVVEREVIPDGDILSNVWTVAAGDPKGRYILRVTIEQLEPIVHPTLDCYYICNQLLLADQLRAA